MPVATPTDVHAELDTNLSDSDIITVLERVERDIDREYGATPGFSGPQHRTDFEAALAALRIAVANAPDGQDRTAEEVSTGASSVRYETDIVAALRKRVRRRDPGNAFGSSPMIRRDTDRHISTTDSES